MPSLETPRVAPALAGAGRRRWDEMLGSLASLLPEGPAWVLIDGAGERQAVLADRLATLLNTTGRPCVRLPKAEGNGSTEAPRIPGKAIRLADGPGWRNAQPWDVVIWPRYAHPSHDGSPDGENAADVVIDMHDPSWPVIRRVAEPLACRGQWYLTETRAFFACRAASWDVKFGDDQPSYAAAVTRAGIADGGVVLDIGCGTGRALAPLRRAVGPAGTVIAIDVTPEMLSQARPASVAASAALVLADARSLPVADAAADAIFAAGLVNHLPDAVAGLRELARVTRPGGLLVLFHPSGRAALAARHGRPLSPDEPLAPGPLRRLTGVTGWRLTDYDDAADRFFAVAVRADG